MRTRPWLLVALVVVLVASSLGAAATDTEPSVDVTVESTPIGDGDTYETGDEVDVTIDAAVGNGSLTGDRLTQIVVRVDGERYRSIEPNATDVTETVRPDLAPGTNDVRVIATDDEGNVNATQFTIDRDPEPPHVFLRSPYETAPWQDISDGNVTGTNVTLAGNIIEDSEMDRLKVTHEFGDYRKTHTFRDVEENFSLPLVLGYGGDGDQTNEFGITATDEFGNVRTYEFDISAGDGRKPNISLRPYPKEASRTKITIAGRITDDVWVESANFSVRGPSGNRTAFDTAVSPNSYDRGDNRWSATFEEPMYLDHTATYEATVTATDAAGKTTTETITIDRIRPDGDVGPRIAVDEGRTVVLDEETLFLSGAVLEGVTERVAVETRDAATGETLDYQVVHASGRTERVEFDREVGVTDGRTEVIVRATAANGTELDERFFVDGSTESTFVGDGDGADDEPAWPRVTLQQLSDGGPGANSSTVTVRRAPGGSSVDVSDEAGASSVAETANVSLETLVVAVDEETNFTSTVTVSERLGGALPAPANSAAAATVDVRHSLAAANVDGVTLDVRVRRGYLESRGLTPANLTMHRRSGGNWTDVGARVVAENDTHVRYRADSPGLSVFSLGAVAPEWTSEPGFVATPRNGSDWAPELEPDDGTSTGDDATDDSDAGEDPGNESASDEPAGQAQILVTNATVNRTAVAVNDSVRVNATLANRGDAGGSYTAGLYSVHDGNATFATKRAVTVPADERRTVEFDTAFAETGNHTVSVNGTRAGPISVESDGGGLLSMFAFLPLGLIGMALGGVLGLVLVLVLVRFVLRRVGGGESAGG